MASKREVLKEAAVVMTCGKLVAPGTALEKWVPGPTYDTPCNASDHHSYLGIPSLCTAAAPLTRNPTFSCSVNRPTRSATRFSTLLVVSQNPRLVTDKFPPEPQANTACALVPPGIDKTCNAIHRRKTVATEQGTEAGEEAIFWPLLKKKRVLKK
uniref:Uncharacterized protein n=1 Tax=Opuntia streptacantha TaxID=393608 RepID=A0A7C8ZAB2_OPUST